MLQQESVIRVSKSMALKAPLKQLEQILVRANSRWSFVLLFFNSEEAITNVAPDDYLLHSAHWGCAAVPLPVHFHGLFIC